MKRLALFACVLSLPAMAQMQMPMPMGDQAEHPSPLQARPKRSPAPKADRSEREKASPAQSVPMGKLADGDVSSQARPASDSPGPVVLNEAVQEQEHPDRRTGSQDTPLPDLLAEARSREPRPLAFFTGRATASNPTLRQADAQVRRLRAEARQAGLWQNPEIGYEADHVRGGSYAGGEQGGYVQQTIPLGGQRSAARGAIDSQAIAAEQQLTAQKQRVDAAVQQAFYAALSAQREAEIREQMLVLASNDATATHQFANIGQADAPDVLASEVELEQAKLELASAQHLFRKAFATLASVCGDSGTPMTLLQGDLEAVPQLAGDSAMDAAKTSPVLSLARQQVLASGAAIRSAHAQARPELTLKAGLQQDNEPLDSSRSRVGVVGIAQAGFTVPLWNRNQGAVQAAVAQRVSAEAEVARTELLLQMQAKQAMEDYANAAGQIRRYREEMLPRAKRAAELYQQKYVAMAAAYPQRVAARKLLLQLELDYTRQLSAAWKEAILLQHGLLQDGLAPVGSLVPSAVAVGGTE